MIKHCLLTIFILGTINISVRSQERLEKELPAIGTEVLGELKEAIGWMLNPDGKWVSRKNKIPAHLSTELSALIDHEYSGLGVDNFTSYELRELSFQKNTYYVLIKKYNSGHYRYPKIKEEWIAETAFNAYIFPKSEWEKLGLLVDGKSNIIEIDLVDFVHIKASSDKEAFELIPLKINWEREVDKKTSLVFHAAPYKDKGMVQFQIYTLYGKYKIIGGIIKEYKVSVDYSRGTPIYHTDELLKHCYYEVDLPSFQNLTKLK
jgi:hypothetical protein